MTELCELPFYGLADNEFMKTTGAWVFHSCSLLPDSRDLFCSVLESPDKDDELNMSTIESKYYSIKQTGKQFQKASVKGFSIFSCNIRSLPKNLCLLNDILLTFEDLPTVITMSETRLRDNHVCNISITGYEFISKASDTNAGGVGMYVKDNVNFIRRSDLEISLNGVETCFIEIPRIRQKNLIIGSIYRHPHSDREDFKENMKDKLEYLNSRGYEVYITGDINQDFFCYGTDKATSNYLDMLFNLGYMPLITKPTRITNHSATLIDHIYSNAPHKVLMSGICLADISDHLPCFCTLATKIPFYIREKYFRDFSHFNRELFDADLAKIDFNMLANTGDVNSDMSNIINSIQEVTNKHAPIRKVTNSKRRRLKKPWITNGILKSVKVKQKLFKSHFLSRDQDKVKFYKTYNNKLNRIKEKARQYYLSAQFYLNKEDVKMTWKLIGMVTNRKKKSSISIPKLLIKDRCYTDKQSICDQLNSHFVNVGPSLSTKLPIHSNADPTKYIQKTIPNSFFFTPIHEYEVHQQIAKLKVNKSTLGTPIKFVKYACEHICSALTKVYNQSLVQGIVPDILKVSKITPVDKGGEMTDPSNFRPISTLHVFAIIFEKIIQKQLLNYVEKYDILYKFQYGFRKGRSTEQAIAEITDNLKSRIDSNLYTCGVFLDFAKAFDTINHNILLNKMEKYGIRGLPLKWFTSYLTNRQQYVSLAGTDSSRQTMICGVPQGSALGPLLFLIYINDIANCSEMLSFRIFADDTNIFFSSSDPSHLETVLNQELLKTKEWCDINKLSINLKKTNYMIIKSPRKKISDAFTLSLPNIDGSGYTLERKNCIKYLGVLLDDTISWKYHISYISSKISRNTGFFLKLRHYLPIKQLSQLYYNLIYPYLSYATIAWGSACKTHLKKLQVKQNHVIRIMFFANLYGENTDKALPLLNLLDLLTVENIFELRLLQFSHQWHKKQLPSIFDSYFRYASDVHSYNTRYSAKGNFYKARSKTNMGKKTLSALGVSHWQNVPKAFKELSPSCFSKKVKQYLLSKQK